MRGQPALLVFDLRASGAGRVEQCVLRCNYHGWLFNHEGRCIQQPYEETVDPESRFNPLSLVSGSWPGPDEVVIDVTCVQPSVTECGLILGER